MVYADLNNNGTIEPATEIVEENNYYPFGLKHQGYNNLPGDGYKYKFLNKEYEDSFGLNVTETDFRQYDAAIGRFNVMDMLSELAPNQTPYRYGFNNPVFWSDPSGLFETEAAARMFAKENDINDYMITSDGKGRYILTITAGEFAGEQFYEMEVLVIDNKNDGGGGGGSADSFGLGLGVIGTASNGLSGYAMYKAASGFKSNNNLWNFHKLSPKQQNWRINAELRPNGNAVLGKHGLNILKYSKAVGVVGTAVWICK